MEKIKNLLRLKFSIFIIGYREFVLVLDSEDKGRGGCFFWVNGDVFTYMWFLLLRSWLSLAYRCVIYRRGGVFFSDCKG